MLGEQAANMTARPSDVSLVRKSDVMGVETSGFEEVSSKSGWQYFANPRNGATHRVAPVSLPAAAAGALVGRRFGRAFATVGGHCDRPRMRMQIGCLNSHGLAIEDVGDLVAA